MSQFTLLADARHGRRPDFIQAASPEVAEPLCDQVKAMLEAKGLRVETGRFRTHMEVSLLNDGPVTILLDSRKDVLTMDQRGRPPPGPHGGSGAAFTHVARSIVGGR